MYTQRTQRQGTTREYGHSLPSIQPDPASPSLAKSKEMHKGHHETYFVRSLLSQMEQPPRCCASLSRTQEIIYQCHRGANKVVKCRWIRAAKISFFSAGHTKYTFFVFLLFLAEFLTLITICDVRRKGERWIRGRILRTVTGPGRCIFEINGDKVQISMPFKVEGEFNFRNGTYMESRLVRFGFSVCAD